MHELAICQSLIGAVEQMAAEHGAGRDRAYRRGHRAAFRVSKRRF